MAFQQFGGNKDLGGLFDAYTGALSQGQQYVQNQLQNDDQAMQNLFDEYRIPMELRTKAGEAAKGDWYASPEGQTAFGNVQTGQGLSQLSAGQKAQALLPFVIKAEQAEAGQKEGEAALRGDVFQSMRTQWDPTLDPNVREAAGQRANLLARDLSINDPKTIGAAGLLGAKNDTIMDKAELDNETRLAIASMRAQEAANKISQPKYKEQLMSAIKKLADPNATPQELYEANMVIFQDKQLRIAANPGAYGQKLDLGGFGYPMTPSPASQVTEQAPKPPGQQAPQPAAAAPDIKTQVESAGIKYEPDSYDYRVVDGKVQRKKKDK